MTFETGHIPTKKGQGAGLLWLIEHVNYDGPDCLIWPFSRNEKGYGQVGVDGKVRKAHRVMCTLVNGEPPDASSNAAHSCHNGHLGCVHPKHLDWQTPSQNTQASAPARVGVRMPRRMTIEKVAEIRASKKTQAELAAEYGIATSTVGQILRGESWVKVRSKLTAAQIRMIREAPESECLKVGKSIGINSIKVRKIRAGITFQGVQ